MFSRARLGAILITLLAVIFAWASFALAQDDGSSAPAGPSGAAQTGDSGADGADSGPAPGPVAAEPLTESAVSVQAFHGLLPNDYIRIVVNAGDVFSYDRTVDANGNITLPLVADGARAADGTVPHPPLYVEGQTVYGVESLLQQLYSQYYVSPSVNVALLGVGRAQVLLVYPTGSFTIRSIVNGQTLYDLLSPLLGNNLEYRYAYVIRGGYDVFRDLTRQQPLPLGEVPALPPAETPGASGVLSAELGTGDRNGLRLANLLALPGAQTFTIDIASMERGGQLGQNLELRAGDIIFMAHFLNEPPPAAGVLGPPEGMKLVQIYGTSLPGTYNLLPNETLADLLKLAAFRESPGLDLRNVLIERHDASGQLRRVVLNLDPATSKGVDLSTVQLAHRDTIRIVPYVNQVFVVGDIRSGGAFPYSPTFKVFDYLALAGGPDAEAHLKFVTIVRQRRTVGAQTEQPQAINVNLALDMKGQPQAGYSILPGDIIYVPSKGYEPSIRDITSALSSVFLGINFFDNLIGTSSAGK